MLMKLKTFSAEVDSFKTERRVRRENNILENLHNLPKLWLSRFLIFLTLARAPSSFFPLRTTPRKESLRRTIVMNLIRLACHEIKEKLPTLSFNWIYYFFTVSASAL